MVPSPTLKSFKGEAERDRGGEGIPSSLLSAQKPMRGLNSQIGEIMTCAKIKSRTLNHPGAPGYYFFISLVLCPSKRWASHLSPGITEFAVNEHVHTQAHTSTHMHMHIHMRAHTHTHTHTLPPFKTPVLKAFSDPRNWN